MWTTVNTIVVTLCTLNILFWLVSMALNMSLLYIIDELKCNEMNQIPVKKRAQLGIKLQFIICLVLIVKLLFYFSFYT